MRPVNMFFFSFLIWLSSPGSFTTAKIAYKTHYTPCSAVKEKAAHSSQRWYISIRSTTKVIFNKLWTKFRWRGTVKSQNPAWDSRPQSRTEFEIFGIRRSATQSAAMIHQNENQSKRSGVLISNSVIKYQQVSATVSSKMSICVRTNIHFSPGNVPVQDA
jgi:hypothetical protein